MFGESDKCSKVEWVRKESSSLLKKSEKLKLNAHTKVTYKIEAGRLIVEPIPSLKEVLEEKPSVEITFEEFNKHRKELSTKAEI